MDATTLRYQRDAARVKMRYHLKKIAEAKESGQEPRKKNIDKAIDFGLKWEAISDQLSGINNPKHSKRATW